MQVIHRIAFTDEPSRREVLRLHGVEVVEPTSSLVRMIWFDIGEDHPAWREIRVLSEQWGASDITTTKFTRKEIHEAKLLQIATSWHQGYPQPEEDFGYLSETYDLSDYCRNCGIGRRQIAPFRLKGEPNWGRHHFLQLNWVFDEFFVVRKIWNDLLKPLRIDCLPVVDHGTGKELNTIVQIDIRSIAPSHLSMSDEEPCEVCHDCSRKKYLPITSGCFPSLKSTPENHMFKTQELFGSGASAWHAVIVSPEFLKVAELSKLRGITFVPLKDRANP